MIVTRTPYRISFFGGGTDYHTWYEEHGGAVLSTSINHACTLMCAFKPPFFDKKHRIVWREIEEENDIKDIKHPVVREVLKTLNVKRGIELLHKGDLPARSGLGSSSAFTVGFLNAIYGLRGELSTKQHLAVEAVYFEREILKEAVGVQDQIAAAYGGFNKTLINKDGSFQVIPVAISEERKAELNGNLMLFFTGVSRTASTIAKDKIANIPSKQVELLEMYKMVDIATNILTSNSNLSDFGLLLHESWMLKKGLSQAISNDSIDDIYKLALKAGATGGKVLGAGGGGFLLFYVEKDKQPSVLKALSDLLWVPFDFENQGSHVAFSIPTKFSRESLLRRDYSHLKDARKFKNVQNLTRFITDDKPCAFERKTKFNIVGNDSRLH